MVDNVTDINRWTSWEQDGVVQSIDPKFSFLVPHFFGTVKQFTTEAIEWDIVEGGRRIAPFVSPWAMGKPTRSLGSRVYQIKPAYIKLLDGVFPADGFVRRPGEAYGGSMSPMERLDKATGEKTATHIEMVETRWEQMASDVLFNAQLVIVDDDYPRAVVDFERNANLTATVSTLWSNSSADPVGDITAMADKVNQYSRGAVVNELLMRSTVWDKMMGLSKVRDLVDRVKAISPGTSALELGGRSAARQAQYRGKLAGQYDIWTYDGYYENDIGAQAAFVPAGKVLLTANQGENSGIEGRRYHGAIMDLDAKMSAVEVFTKYREQWNPSGREVLTQSAPLLGMRRPNASAVITVL